MIEQIYSFGIGILVNLNQVFVCYMYMLKSIEEFKDGNTCLQYDQWVLFNRRTQNFTFDVITNKKSHNKKVIRN